MSVYQIKLRSGELYVLAGLLGYKSLIGVEDDTLIKWHKELRSRVHRTIRSLEKKKIVQTTLNGVLYIDENLKSSIDILCNAEYIGMFASNVDNKRTETIYLTCSANKYVILKKYKDNKYLLSFTDTLDSLDSIFASFLQSDKNIHEFLLYEDAEYIKELLFSFDEVGAVVRTRKCIKDKDIADDIVGIVSGKNKFLNIQIHKKQGDFFINSFNSFLVQAGKNTVELKLDNNRILYIDSMDAELIKNKVKCILSSK